MTADEPLCPLTELPQNTCPHCQHHGRMPKRKLSTGEFGMPFLARTETACGNCGLLIHPGDVTARLADGGYGCWACLP